MKAHGLARAQHSDHIPSLEYTGFLEHTRQLQDTFAKEISLSSMLFFTLVVILKPRLLSSNKHRRDTRQFNWKKMQEDRCFLVLVGSLVSFRHFAFKNVSLMMDLVKQASIKYVGWFSDESADNQIRYSQCRTVCKLLSNSDEWMNKSSSCLCYTSESIVTVLQIPRRLPFVILCFQDSIPKSTSFLWGLVCWRQLAFTEPCWLKSKFPVRNRSPWLHRLVS